MEVRAKVFNQFVHCRHTVNTKMESQDMFSETVLEDLANQFYDKTRASVQKLCYGCKVGELIFMLFSF